MNAITLLQTCDDYSALFDSSFNVSRNVSSHWVFQMTTQAHEHMPLAMGTASLPNKVSYHSTQPNPLLISVGSSIYHVPQIAHVSCHLSRSSACEALSRKYSGNSHAFSMSARMKFVASVREANSTRDGINDLSSGREGH